MRVEKFIPEFEISKFKKEVWNARIPKLNQELQLVQERVTIIYYKLKNESRKRSNRSESI